MLPGRYIDVMTDFDDPLDLVGITREGYLKLAWKTQSSIKVGYIIFQRGEVLASMIENIPGGSVIEGDQALKEIIDTARQGLVHAIELYEARVGEIVQEHPNAVITINKAPSLPGNDLKSLIHFIRDNKGTLKIQNTSKAWILQFKKGKVIAAKAIKGSHTKGDDAIGEILKEMGHILKDGEYTPDINNNTEFTPNDVVQEDNFLEGINLLREKIEFEKTHNST